MLPQLPAELQAQAASAAERLGLAADVLTDAQRAALAFSDFIAENLQRQPEWWLALQQQPPQPDEWQHYARWLDDDIAAVDSEAALMRALRLFRRRILVRIAWMQCLHDASTEQSLQQLSVLAEVLIGRARD